MSYNVNYLDLPTFQQNSIGYSENKKGVITIPQGSTGFGVFNLTSFNLGIGLYIITINVFNMWVNNLGLSLGISSTSTSVTTPLSITNAAASMNGNTVISQTTSGTIYVNIQTSQLPPTTFQPYYNVSIVRIA